MFLVLLLLSRNVIGTFAVAAASVSTDRVRPLMGIVAAAAFIILGETGEIGLDSNTDPPTAEPYDLFGEKIEFLRAGTGSLLERAYFRNS